MEAAVRVLVVEDDDLIQHILEDALTEAGFGIQKAFNARDAITLLGASDTHFRALITDIELKSEMTGWDVARHARTISPDLPVVYASSSGHDWESLGVPNSIMVRKPFAPAQVVTAVSQLINAAPKAAT